MGRCKNCKYWDSVSRECCEVEIIDEEFQPEGSDCTIYVHVSDDHNLNVKLKTGPMFGCVWFTP